MTLANIACILAERTDLDPNKGILMMDWDLEAPGLHRYFYNRLAPKKRSNSSQADDNCDSMPGLIDLFYLLDDKIDEIRSKMDAPESIVGEEAALAILNEINLDEYIIPTKISRLSLLKAGRFNPDDTNEYPERVNKFQWEELYKKSPQLFRVFADVLAEKYEYVLIDSRTGVTDISGVCTMLLPEKLVVVFTPNMQSLLGAVDVVCRVTDYRKESDDLRPLIVYPLVSRVESNEPVLREQWRYGDAERGIKGYQAEFESVLAEAYGKSSISMDLYFDEMQIQHIPRYAYGEEIAVLVEKIEDKFSLRRSYRTFADILLAPGLPWEKPENASSSLGNYSTSYPRSEPFTPASGGKFILLQILIVGFVGIVVALVAFWLGYWGATEKPPANGVNQAQNSVNINTKNSNYNSEPTGNTNGVNVNGPSKGNSTQPNFLSPGLGPSPLTPVSQWAGTWTTASGAYYTWALTLNDDGSGNITGQCYWTLLRTPLPELQNKIGVSATEYVAGSFFPKAQTFVLKGYKKDDPNGLLRILDTYKLILSADNQRLTGVAANSTDPMKPKWNGKIDLTKLQDGTDTAK